MLPSSVDLVRFVKGHPRLKTRDLASRLDVSKDEFDDFVDLLLRLQLEGSLVRAPLEGWDLPERSDYRVGRLQIDRRGQGFVRVAPGSIKEDDIFVGRDGVGNAYDGDMVLVLAGKRPRRPGGGALREGKVVDVVQRSRRAIRGRFLAGPKGCFVKPENAHCKSLRPCFWGFGSERPESRTKRPTGKWYLTTYRWSADGSRTDELTAGEKGADAYGTPARGNFQVLPGPPPAPVPAALAVARRVEPHDGLPFDFDQVRVFTWNLRRHRYETAYRERKLAGLFPVTVTRENFDKEGTLPVFILWVKDDAGTVNERKYKLNTPIVKRVLAPGESPAKLVRKRRG